MVLPYEVHKEIMLIPAHIVLTTQLVLCSVLMDLNISCVLMDYIGPFRVNLQKKVTCSLLWTAENVGKGLEVTDISDELSDRQCFSGGLWL